MSPTLIHVFLLKSLQKQWREFQRSYRRCRKELSEKSIHRFRVQCRRLLSTATVLAAVSPAKAPLEAGRLLKSRLDLFARLRDTNVQLLALEKEKKRFPEIGPFRRFLAKKEKRLTKRVARGLKRSGLSTLAATVKRIIKTLKSQEPDRARSRRNLRAAELALKRAFDDVAALYRKIDLAHTTSIHRTRVAFKKYRYMTEALQPRLIRVSSSMHKRMHDYQSRMGAIQDVEVLQATWQKFLGKRKARRSGRSEFGAEIARRRQKHIASFAKRGNELFDFGPRKFADRT